MIREPEKKEEQLNNLPPQAAGQPALLNTLNTGENSEEEVAYHTERSGMTYQIRTVEDPDFTRKRILDQVLGIEKRALSVYHTIRRYPGYMIMAECLKRDTSLLQISEIPYIRGINNSKLANALAIVARKSMAMLLDKSLEDVHDDIRHIHKSAASVIASLTNARKEEVREESYAVGSIISKLLVLDKYLIFKKKNKPLQLDMRFLQLQMLTEACMANLEKNGVSYESCSEVHSALTIATDLAEGLFGSVHEFTIGLKNCAREVYGLFLSHSTKNPPENAVPNTPRVMSEDVGTELPPVPPTPNEVMTSYLNNEEYYLCEEGRHLRNQIIRRYNSPAGVYGSTPLKFLKPNADYIKTTQPHSFFKRLSGLLDALASIEDPVVYAQPFDHHFPYPPGSTNCMMYACPDSWQTLKVACNALVLANELFRSGYKATDHDKKGVDDLYYRIRARKNHGLTDEVLSIIRFHFFKDGAPLIETDSSLMKEAVLFCNSNETDSLIQPQEQQHTRGSITRAPSEYKLLGLDLDPDNYKKPQNAGKLREYIKLSKLPLQCILKTAEDRKLHAGEVSDSESNLLTDVSEAYGALESAVDLIDFVENNNNDRVLSLVQEMITDLLEDFEKTSKDDMKAHQIRIKSLIRECSSKLRSLRNVSEIVRSNAEEIISFTEEAFCIKPKKEHEKNFPAHEEAAAAQVAISSRSLTVQHKQIHADRVDDLKECEKLVESLKNVVTVECPIKSVESITDHLKHAFSRMAHARTLCVDAGGYCTSLKGASSSILGALTTIHRFKPITSFATSMELLGTMERCAKILETSLQAALTEETNSDRIELLLQAKKSASTAINALKYIDTNSEIIKEYSIASIAQDTFKSCMKDISNVSGFRPPEDEITVHTGTSACTRDIHLHAALSANTSIIALLKLYAASWHKKNEKEIVEEGPALYDITEKDILLLNLYEALQSMQFASRCFIRGNPPSALLDTYEDLKRLVHDNVFMGTAFTDPEESAKSIEEVSGKAQSLLELVHGSQELETSKTSAAEAIKRISILLGRSSYALKKGIDYPMVEPYETSGIAAFPSEVLAFTKYQRSTNCSTPPHASVRSEPQLPKRHWFSKTISSLKQKFFPGRLSEDEISSSIEESIKKIEILLENIRQYSLQDVSLKSRLWENVDNFYRKSLELTKVALKSKVHSDILAAECHCIGSIFTINRMKTIPTANLSMEQLQKATQLRKEISFMKKMLHTYATNKKNAFLRTGEGIVMLQPCYTDLFVSWDTLNSAHWTHNKGLIGVKRAVKEIRRVYGSNAKIKAHVSLLETLFEQQDWESIGFICNNCIVCGANGDASLQEVLDLFQRNLRNDSNKDSDLRPKMKPQRLKDKIRMLFTKKESPKSRDDVPLFLKAFIKNSCSRDRDNITGGHYYKLPRCDIDPIISSLYKIPASHHVAAFLLYRCTGAKVNASTLLKCQSTQTIYSFFDYNPRFHSVTSGSQEASEILEQNPATNHALVSRGVRDVFPTKSGRFSLQKTTAKTQTLKTKSFFLKSKPPIKNAASREKVRAPISHSSVRARRRIMLNGVDIFTGEKYHEVEINHETTAHSDSHMGVSSPDTCATASTDTNSIASNTTHATESATHAAPFTDTHSTAPSDMHSVASHDMASTSTPAEYGHTRAIAPTIIPSTSNGTHLFFDDKGAYISPTAAGKPIKRAHYVGTVSEVSRPSQSERVRRKVLTVHSYCGEIEGQGVSVKEGCSGDSGKSPKLAGVVAPRTQFVRSLKESGVGSCERRGVRSTSMATVPSTHLGGIKEDQGIDVSAQRATFTSECVSSVHNSNEHKADMKARQL